MLSGWGKEIFMQGNEDSTTCQSALEKNIDTVKNILSSSTKIKPTVGW